MLAFEVVGPLAPGSEIAGYRIEGVLGRGGMGIVYEATQLSLGRRVALKVVTPLHGDDPEFLERFRREGMAQAAIDHPNVVTVYEAGSADGQLFIAMRLVRGGSLKEALAGGALDPARAVALLAPVADALDAAHAAGLVHRDVKSHNILIGPGDVPYLADFGLTKVTGQTSLTASGLYMGTPDYTAPEVAQGDEATAASDVYAFAAVAYECLTGTPPFAGRSQPAVLYAHVHEPLPPASERRPELPIAVDAVLARGLAKDPAQRAGSARDVIDGLAAALGDQAGGLGAAATTQPLDARARPAASAASRVVEAPVPGPTAAGARPLRRAPRTAAIGIAVLAVAAGGAALLVASRGNGGDARTGGGATVVLGSSLESEATGVGECSGDPGKPRPPCTTLQTALPGRRVRAPFDGVVTRWRVRGARGRMALAVLRGGEQPRRVAVSRAVRVPGTGVHGFATDLRVRTGDRLALQLGSGAHFGYTERRGARLARWAPHLIGPEPPDYTTPGDLEILYSGDLVPDGR